MKKKLRQERLIYLKSLTKNEKNQQETAILKQFFSSQTYQKSRTIGIYLAFSFEFDTMKVIEHAIKDGKRLVIPKTLPNHQLIFAPYDKKTLTLSRFGIMEPTNTDFVSEIDLLVVPGVAFNAQGFRIGFGGGYYDRYLADFKGKTVSFVFKGQLADFTPEAYDINVQKLYIGSSNDKANQF
ncbi:MAG: 5-formyltetrahydrofolate cyclo-ligase [Streptococcaceae bacterium]|nr:5-formyltetrahydrofolate cyclo-ligase [Streptococcaceae bacterium]